MAGESKITIDVLKGVNQDGNLLSGEVTEACNVIGEPTGFSVWKGRTKYTKQSINGSNGLYHTIFPDGHKTLVVKGKGTLHVIESGTVYTLSIGDQVAIQAALDTANTELDRITDALPAVYDPEIPDALWEQLKIYPPLNLKKIVAEYFPEADAKTIEALTPLFSQWRTAYHEVAELTDQLVSVALALNQDPRNPTHFTMFSRNRYLIGSNYLKDPAWSWDGNIDRDPEPIYTHGMRFSQVEAWGGRLWGLNAKDTNTDMNFPLYAFYGDIDELEIPAGQWLEFRDNPLASKLVAMRSFTRDYAFVWGDRGLWQVQLTGSYPIFVLPQLIDAECDCVASGSIVEIPGVGFMWRGLNCYWLLSGGQVRKINLSNDERQANRIKDGIDACPLDSLFLIHGVYYKKRNVVIWSYPTHRATISNPWEDPKSDVYDLTKDAWWCLNQGWQGAVEVAYSGERMIIVTDNDGYIYLADRNTQFDKDEFMQWHIEFPWKGSDTNKLKWLWAILKRPFQGTNKVMVEFWCRNQADAIESSFTLDESFDDASLGHITYATGQTIYGDLNVVDSTGFPNPSPGTSDIAGIIEVTNDEGTVLSLKYYDPIKTGLGISTDTPLSGHFTTNNKVEIKAFDPGGPNDAGLSPEAQALSKIPIRLVGEKLKIRLSNKYTDDDGNDAYHNGPDIPCLSLTLIARELP